MDSAQQGFRSSSRFTIATYLEAFVGVSLQPNCPAIKIPLSRHEMLRHLDTSLKDHCLTPEDSEMV